VIETGELLECFQLNSIKKIKKKKKYPVEKAKGVVAR
jgi:hypothetical protein